MPVGHAAQARQGNTAPLGSVGKHQRGRCVVYTGLGLPLGSWGPHSPLQGVGPSVLWVKGLNACILSIQIVGSFVILNGTIHTLTPYF